MDPRLLALRAEPRWEARMRLLLQLGDALPPWPLDEHRPEHQVSGCTSPVWLQAYPEEGGWHLRAYTEPRLLRGLIAAVLLRAQGASSTEIHSIDWEQWLKELGFGHHLSASRVNGLRAVIQALLRQVH